MGKRSSLVLEVLVAFLLAAMALSIIAPSPHAVLKRELKVARKMEAERVATLTLNEVYPLVVWDEMPPASSKIAIPLKNYPVKLTSDISFTLSRTCKMGYLKEFSDNSTRLISCEIKVDKHPFHFYFSQKKNS